MTRSRRKPTPNYNIMFQSAVGALQTAYEEYKKARVEQLRWTFFDNDGNFCFLDRYKERKERVDNAEENVARLLKEVEKLRGFKGEAKMDGERSKE